MNACVCLYSLPQQSHVAHSKRGPPMCLFGDPRPNTEAILYHWWKKKKESEWGRKRKEERINQAWRETKATGQGGPKCHLASNSGEKKGGEKEKRKSRVYQRKVLFLFLDSWVSYYGIRFNQCPSRNVEQRAGGNGWKSLGDDVGRLRGKRVGLGEGWGAVRWLVGWVREAQCGRAWQSAQGEGKPQCWGPRGSLPTVQLLLILNSWHIMGIQALVVLW